MSKGPSTDSLSFLSSQQKGVSVDLDSDFCVFYAQSEYEHSGHQIVNPSDRFVSQYSAFDALQSVCRELGIPVFLKFHPLHERVKNSPYSSKHRLDWELVQLLDNVSVIPEDSAIDTYELMKRAKYNVVWSSTVGLECVARGITPIVLGFPLWLNREWGIHAWSKSALKRTLVEEQNKMNCSVLIPYFFYLHSFGVSCRFSNRDAIWNKEVGLVSLTSYTLIGRIRERLVSLKKKLKKVGI